MDLTLFVGGLPSTLTDQVLQDLFRTYGTVVSAEVMMGPTGLCVGFVQMSTIKETLIARYALHRSKFHDDVLFVTFADTRINTNAIQVHARAPDLQDPPRQASSNASLP